MQCGDWDHVARLVYIPGKVGQIQDVGREIEPGSLGSVASK
jgi:hypothetical protein